MLNAVEGTELVIVPSIPEGHKIVSVIDNNGNIVWNDETSIDSRIVYVVGNTDIELTVNYQVIGYSLKITLDPLNDAVSGNADMSITVGNDTEIFTPTQQNPVSMYTNVLYGTSISITTPSFIGEYAFSYWATDDGSFDTPSISFIMTQNTKCCAVYSLT